MRVDDFLWILSISFFDEIKRCFNGTTEKLFNGGVLNFLSET